MAVVTHAPVVVRRRRIFRPADWVLFAVCAAVNLATLTWLAWRAVDGLALSRAPWVVVMLLPVIVAVLSYELRWFTLPLMSVPEPVEPVPGPRVAAVTTFVPHIEPLDMLRRTVSALVAMRGPHDTWVLDEGDDPDARRLCEELGARHFSRRDVDRYQQPSGPFASRSKHGNYNAWLDAVGYENYDVVVGFDPDHIAKPSFLERTLGYLRDPRIGYVQAAQVYYNQGSSFIARGGAEETYAYYSSVQMTTHSFGYPILTGCHQVHRTVALREVGGFAAHEADDLLLGLLYRSAGWEGVYVPETLAVGITPVDWHGYLTQQRRWARANVDLKLWVFPRLAKRLPLIERIAGMVHGLYYLHGPATAIGIALTAVGLALGWRLPVTFTDSWRVAAAAGSALVACELFRQRFFLDRRNEAGLHLRAALLKFAKWPTVVLADAEGALGRHRPYDVTAKVRVESTRPLRRPHAAALGLLVGGVAVGLAAGREPAGPVVVAAVIYAAMTIAVLVAERAAVPAPYDDVLAAAAAPWTVTET